MRRRVQRAMGRKFKLQEIRIPNPGSAVFWGTMDGGSCSNSGKRSSLFAIPNRTILETLQSLHFCRATVARDQDLGRGRAKGVGHSNESPTTNIN